MGYFFLPIFTYIATSILNWLRGRLRLVFDQSSPVNPVSESRGGSTSVMDKEEENLGQIFLCLILDS